MSIGADTLFIPRVGFKVNLLVAPTDRPDQHIQYGGAQAGGRVGHTAARLKHHGKTYLLRTRAKPCHTCNLASIQSKPSWFYGHQIDRF